MAYKEPKTSKKDQNPKETKIQKTQSTLKAHLQRNMTCTFTPFSLSFLLVEFDSEDLDSLADLSLDRGV
jgi:hypothetical protein